MAAPGTRRSPEICEVGPRDGIQNASVVLDVAVRAELVNRLARCGVDRIEVGSFVSPRAVPQMADTEKVFERIERVPGVRYAALALNRKGAERALAAGVDELHFAFAVTPTFNARNQGATVQESVAAFGEIARLAEAASVRATVTVAAAFGCPFEGEVSAEAVVDAAVELARRGAREILFADTIGVGVPLQVERLFATTREALASVGPGIDLGGHFHDTRGTGIANADAALRAGATVLDTAVGGYGGCPFAPGAAGNIATEDLGYLLRQSGLPVRLDLENLLETGRWLAEKLGRPVPGALARAGLFPENVERKSAA